MIFLLIPACKGKREEANLAGCKYSYNPTKTKLQWTAYKFTEKAGVNGAFHTFSATGTTIADSPHAVFQGMNFAVDGQSADTGNPERDKKIKSAFFSALKDKGRITGKVNQVTTRSANITLQMNGVQKDINAEIIQNSATDLLIKIPLDINDFNAGAALKSLNAVCSELHTGKDKKSVLWPNVEVKIEVSLSPICPG